MAYYTGTVNDMAELRQALIDACVTEGWAWDGGTNVLSKETMFLHTSAPVADYFGVTGRTGPTGGDMPSSVGIGRVGSTTQGQSVTFPAAYEVFAFNSEIYLVINYNVDIYQWLAFGQSTVDGLPGTGMWVGGTRGEAQSTGLGIRIQLDSSAGNNYCTPALSWMADYTYGPSRNFWVHSDLDSQGWLFGSNASAAAVGIVSSFPLLSLLPNTWNQEAVLLPIRAYRNRLQSKISLIADLQHSRYTRVDNYEPGQIVMVGLDRWKILPWYRKNAAARDGGQNINHSGTFGWAVRYEGP